MESSSVSYFNEISMMMYGFGDSHKPNPDTVRLVESITSNQLQLILQEGLKILHRCSDQDSINFNEITGKELVFLMRKNKNKMRRFVKYLQNKDNHKRREWSLEPKPENQQRNNPLLDFIEYIDETGELTDVAEYDEVKQERMLRADRISQALDVASYLKFEKARSTSFLSKSMSQLNNFRKLKSWIDPQNEFNVTDCAMEVLSYYAYETVALLTDYALLARRDHNQKMDPFASLQAGTYYSGSMFNIKHNDNSKPDYSSVYHGQPPISVAEIKEVMRRLRSPQAGFINLGTKVLPNKEIIAI